MTTKLAYLSEVKNIHVCLVTISLGKGGAERAVANQSRMFAQMGYRVTTVVLRDPIDYEYSGELLHLGGKNPSPSGGLQARGRRYRLRRFWRFYRFLQRDRPQVIIDHRPKKSLIKEWIYRKLIYRSQRVIYVCHSAYSSIYLTHSPGLFRRLLEPNTTLVSVSKHINDVILANQGFKNRTYIPNALSKDWFDFNLDESHRTNLDGGNLSEGQSVKNKQSGDDGPSDGPEADVLKQPYLLWYGRLDQKVKDLRFLIHAFDASMAKTKGIRLVILGSGPDAHALKELTRTLSLKDSVKFIDFDPKPQQLIAQAHAICLTSFYEGFPMVILESLALGTPVISLDIISGPSELIQHNQNGLLVSERNSRTFAEAIDRMCLDPVFYERAKAAARDSVKPYHESIVAQRWKQLIENASHHH